MNHHIAIDGPAGAGKSTIAEAAVIAACERADVSIAFENGEQVVLLDSENVNGLIRTEAVGNMASACSAIARVREIMVERQQKLAKNCDVVMDGRDIGTVVLPDAHCKIFLTASAKVRAKRRYDELVEKGVPCDLKQIEEDIIKRDERDTTRAASPLRQAEDAVLVDTSDMTIDEVIAKIMELSDG